MAGPLASIRWQPDARRALDELVRAGVVHTVHEYAVPEPADGGARSGRRPAWGEDAATALGVDPGRIHKTLIATVDGRLAVAVVPVAAELDLKRLAEALGGRKAAMADPTEAERATGYVRGGISPLGNAAACRRSSTRLRSTIRRSSSRPAAAGSRSSSARPTWSGSPALRSQPSPVARDPPAMPAGPVRASGQRPSAGPVPSARSAWCIWGRRGAARAGILPRGPQAIHPPADRLKTEDRRPPRQDPVVIPGHRSGSSSIRLTGPAPRSDLTPIACLPRVRASSRPRALLLVGGTTHRRRAPCTVFRRRGGKSVARVPRRRPEGVWPSFVPVPAAGRDRRPGRCPCRRRPGRPPRDRRCGRQEGRHRGRAGRLQHLRLHLQRQEARRQARSYGATVYEIYAPHATWARVRSLSQGANLFIYLGHGNGYPSPYGAFNKYSKDGLGLDAYDGTNRSSTTASITSTIT